MKRSLSKRDAGVFPDLKIAETIQLARAVF